MGDSQSSQLLEIFPIAGTEDLLRLRVAHRSHGVFRRFSLQRRHLSCLCVLVFRMAVHHVCCGGHFPRWAVSQKGSGIAMTTWYKHSCGATIIEAAVESPDSLALLRAPWRHAAYLILLRRRGCPSEARPADWGYSTRAGSSACTACQADTEAWTGERRGMEWWEDHLHGVRRVPRVHGPVRHTLGLSALRVRVLYPQASRGAHGSHCPPTLPKARNALQLTPCTAVASLDVVVHVAAHDCMLTHCKLSPHSSYAALFIIIIPYLIPKVSTTRTEAVGK